MGSIGWGCQDAAKPETDGLDLYSRGALNGAGRHQMLSAAIFFWDKTRCCHRRANDEPQPSELFFDLLSTRCQFVESCSLAAGELRTHSSGMSAKLFRRHQIESPQPMRNDNRNTLSLLSYLDSLVSSGDVQHLEAAPPNLGVSIPGLATSHNRSPGA